MTTVRPWTPECYDANRKSELSAAVPSSAGMNTQLTPGRLVVEKTVPIPLKIIGLFADFLLAYLRGSAVGPT